MKEWRISDNDDRDRVLEDIKKLPIPYFIMGHSEPPEKGTPEHGNKSRQMAYFHRTIVPAFAKAYGILEDEAKYSLMTKFARLGEYPMDATSVYDIIWKEEDKFYSIEGNKRITTRSLADYSSAELSYLIDQCDRYLQRQFGILVPKYMRNFKEKQR